MRTINLQSAFIFVQVVVSGSFTAAAESLGMPKSTVSDQVAALERELGVTLMVRTTRKLKLTEVGEEYFRKAEAAVRELQLASEQAVESQSRPVGTLKISAPADLTFFNMTDFVSEYRRKFPAVKIELDFTDRVVDLVAEGVDLAVRAGHLRDSSLIAKKVGHSFLVLVASPAYLKRSPAPKHPRELAQFQWIAFSNAPSGHQWELRHAQGGRAPVRASQVIAANSFTAIKSLALNGEGIALVPVELCLGEIKGKKLVHVLPEWSTAANPVHIVYPPQRYASAKVKEAVPILEQKIRAMLDGVKC
jgi:DNA-binding transcriptional LysR family regulator